MTSVSSHAFYSRWCPFKRRKYVQCFASEGMVASVLQRSFLQTGSLVSMVRVLSPTHFVRAEQSPRERGVLLPLYLFSGTDAVEGADSNPRGEKKGGVSTFPIAKEKCTKRTPGEEVSHPVDHSASRGETRARSRSPRRRRHHRQLLAHGPAGTPGPFRPARLRPDRSVPRDLDHGHAATEHAYHHHRWAHHCASCRGMGNRH